MSEDKNNEGYCYICHRKESETGRLIHLPNNIDICTDCMQKTFDGLNKFGIGEYVPPFSFMDATPGNGNEADGDKNESNKEEKHSVSNKENDSTEVISDNKEDDDNNDDKKKKGTIVQPFGLLNLDDLSGILTGQQRVKKKKKKERRIKPVFSIDNMPKPHQIKAKLDEYVIGQDDAKKMMSVAVYNHYKRVSTGTMDDIDIEKSNILMIGPTGSGKTYLVKTLADLLDVPLAISDATSLTEAGYIGDDIESVVSKLIDAADNDIEKAEKGIIFIDEIDKLAKKKNTNQRDVSGEAVQQGMLKLLEGSEVEAPIGASSKNAMVPMAMVNTKNILFIVGGAFPELSDIIKERLNKTSSMGFAADLKDKYDYDKDILKQVTVEDLRQFGMIPEFIGRLPITAVFSPLDEEMLVRILKEPRNAIVKQYQKLLRLDEVDLEFTDQALHAIAKKALQKDLGARALRAVLEKYMMDIMYEVPKDDEIGKVTITEEYIENKGGPLIELRGSEKVIEEKKDPSPLKLENSEE